MFTVRQVMAKEIVVISPTSTIRKTASILSKTNFMLCQYAKVNFGRIVTTTDVINIFGAI
jgi:predicted transcriptional regulator